MVYYGCTNCAGHMIHFNPLKKLIGETDFAELLKVSEHAPKALRPCPSCDKKLRALVHTEGQLHMELDVCMTCQLLWLDQGEIIDFKNLKASRLKVQMSPARLESYNEDLKTTLQDDPDNVFFSDVGPSQSWKWLPALVGLPIEMKPSLLKIVPIITYFLSALVMAIFLASRDWGIDQTALAWGFVPAEPFRNLGLTFLSSFFLHIGFLHILGNLYFLMTFGDDVEQDIGGFTYLCLIFFAHIGGVVLHALLVGAVPTPLVGASAGVFGVLSYYMVRFPNTKVGVLFLLVIFPYWIRIAAKWLFLLKIAYEIAIIAFFNNANGSGGVAHAAHLGGAIVGIVFALFQNQKEQTRVHLSTSSSVFK